MPRTPNKKGSNSGLNLEARQRAQTAIGMAARELSSTWSDIRAAVIKLPAGKTVAAKIPDVSEAMPWSADSAIGTVFDPVKRDIRKSCQDMSVLKKAEGELVKVRAALTEAKRELFPRKEGRRGPGGKPGSRPPRAPRENKADQSGEKKFGRRPSSVQK